METSKKKHNFNIEYRKVKRASRIDKIVDHEIVSICWSNTDTMIYTTLLSMYNAYGEFSVSYSFLAGECNLTEKTINVSVLKMKSFGILNIEQSHKRTNGCFPPNRFTYVADLEESVKFKCVPNKHKKLYDKKKRERNRRLQYLQGAVVSSGWIGAQCRNYWRNVNYELITGEFLKGDKTSKLLYSHSKEFTPHDDLKDFELDSIEEGFYNKTDSCESEDT